VHLSVAALLARSLQRIIFIFCRRNESMCARTKQIKRGGNGGRPDRCLLHVLRCANVYDNVKFESFNKILILKCDSVVFWGRASAGSNAIWVLNNAISAHRTQTLSSSSATRRADTLGSGFPLPPLRAELIHLDRKYILPIVARLFC